MGPYMVNARVLLMGSYRSTYGSAKRFTAIFNSYTPWLGGIIFSGTLWSPYLSLFLSYIWSREDFFDFKNTLYDRPFLVHKILYCDGRMDGRMDGWKDGRKDEWVEEKKIV